MILHLDMPTGLEEQLKQVVLQATQKALKEQQMKVTVKEWLDLKSGAAYAGVSYNTFIKFREHGLKIAEIEGVKRVSKYEIDRFLDEHSF